MQEADNYFGHAYQCFTEPGTEFLDMVVKLYQLLRLFRLCCFGVDNHTDPTHSSKPLDRWDCGYESNLEHGHEFTLFYIDMKWADPLSKMSSDV